MRRHLIAAATVLAALVAPPAPARAATAHDIEIDGSQLFSREFVVVGQGWLDAKTVQTVTLQEGRELGTERTRLRAATPSGAYPYCRSAPGRSAPVGSRAAIC